MCHFVQLVRSRVDVTQEHESVAVSVARAATVAAAAGGGGGNGTAVKGADGAARVKAPTVSAHIWIQGVGSLQSLRKKM